MIFNLPNGSIWDFDLAWSEQEETAQNWMSEAIDPNNANSIKRKINIQPLYYTCVYYEGVEACFNAKYNCSMLKTIQ